ncbi:MAG: LacI family DNA-binding transcriptional regulator [Phycisphaeraceae bacterium]|nr:LacI family DNA-binding transcriptional regulator [Phycisphaeraceae bacterium]
MVAQKAGVSVATTSRLLNHKTSGVPVTEATRQRVILAAKELNYVPNTSAQILRRQATDTIAVFRRGLVEALTSHQSFATSVLAGITKAIGQSEYHLLVQDERDFGATANPLSRGRCDGLILVSPCVDDPLLESLAAQDRPVIALWNRHVPAPMGFVNADQIETGRLAVQYLYGLGHRRIAHMTGPSCFSCALDREEGYRRGMAEHGLAVESGWVFHGNHNMELGKAALHHFLSLANRPTAVFLAGDGAAAGMILAAREAGLRVPGELSVIGSDGIDDPRSEMLHLTSVCQSVERSAALSVTELIKQIRGQSISRCEISLPVTILERGTCGPISS